ncbi:MAG TPA: YIP1 family protein [Bryobacteraceae bacterium]|nr:YIP1 family protein [Bryobacteraceae bacterium]
MSESARLLGVWTHPARILEDVARRPSFLVPLTLIAVSAFAASAALSGSSGALQQILVAAQAASQSALGCVIVAAVLTVAMARVYVAPIEFQRTLAIVAYSMMPGVALALLSAASIQLQIAAGLSPVHPIATNLAAFLHPASTSRFADSLARSLDAITLWEIVLIACGLKIASGGRMSSGTCFRGVFVPWVIYVIGKAALAAQ